MHEDLWFWMPFTGLVFFLLGLALGARVGLPHARRMAERAAAAEIRAASWAELRAVEQQLDRLVLRAALDTGGPVMPFEEPPSPQGMREYGATLLGLRSDDEADELGRRYKTLERRRDELREELIEEPLRALRGKRDPKGGGHA